MFYWIDPPTNPPHPGVFSRWTMIPGVMFIVALCCIVFVRIWYMQENAQVPIWKKLWTSAWLIAGVAFVCMQHAYMFGTLETVERIEEMFPFLQHHRWIPDKWYGKYFVDGHWLREVAWRPPENDPFSWRQIWIGTVPVLIAIVLMWLTWPRERPERPVDGMDESLTGSCL